MQQEKIVAIFDQHAANYDEKWSELAPINASLHLLTASILADLPAEANILSVGAGTGNEILFLAQKFPKWRFTAVEPSSAMLEVFRQRADEHGITARCHFHAGFIESLPPGEKFDAATAFLVSQFIQDRDERAKFFQEIANRLRPSGILVSSDLAADMNAASEQDLVDVWFRVLKGADISAEEMERMREGYRRDVSVLPPQDVEEIIMRGGFHSPIRFFQAGLIHAWYARVAR
jgi:tRNA (cmo5U34)-methyltransferase